MGKTKLFLLNVVKGLRSVCVAVRTPGCPCDVFPFWKVWLLPRNTSHWGHIFSPLPPKRRGWRRTTSKEQILILFLWKLLCFLYVCVNWLLLFFYKQKQKQIRNTVKCLKFAKTTPCWCPLKGRSTLGSPERRGGGGGIFVILLFL